MKPETEILAAYRQLADAQAKKQLADKALARTRAAADQAQQCAGEAANYVIRCEARLAELAKADAAESINAAAVAAQREPVPTPAKPTPISPLPQGKQKR